MQGSDGRDASLSGSHGQTHGDGAGHLVIRADFHARSGHKDSAKDDARCVTTISFSTDGEAPGAGAHEVGVEQQDSLAASDATSESTAAQREAAKLEIERLRLEHRDLDGAITALGGALADQLQVQRLSAASSLCATPSVSLRTS